ncbi:acid-sensing ion channel 1 [Nematostella vectensis]|uniref:acid-sensing ion channel 1 n=1 Tax=Nematostella vectensis TaxID=45351 RepID=UPI0020774EF1|nr:acid-sensing ion channel 1 [Nematostella vectensis]
MTRLESITKKDAWWPDPKEAVRNKDNEEHATEPEQHLSKQADSAKNTLIGNFASYTTLHGLHFLFQPIPRARKIIWGIMLVIATVGLSIQIGNGLVKVYSYNIFTAKTFVRPESLPFPAITICNQNMLRKTAILGSAGQRYLDQLDELRARFIGEDMNVTSERINMDAIVQKSGHQLEKMVYECRFVRDKCDNKSIKVFTSEKRGLCYTFNSGVNGTPLLNVSHSGSEYSLSLRLDAEPTEYYGPYSYDGTGFKIAVHDQKVLPDIEEDAYDISPGFYTKITMKRAQTLFLPSPYSSGCGSRKLQFSQEYSYKNCIRECHTQLMIGRCRCRAIGMTLQENDTTPYCTTREVQDCIMRVHERSSRQRCDCPVPCEMTTFTSRISLAYFPSQHVWETFLPFLTTAYDLNLTGLSPDELDMKAEHFVRKRFAMVKIFYETLRTEMYHQRPAYEMSDLFADVGGNMGLFLGCSMLTIAEFIDLAIMLLITKFWRRRTVDHAQARDQT